MKIYRIDGNGPDGHYVAWASTRTEVRIKRAELKANDVEAFTTTRIDFPTEQAAIVRWLNANLNMDNG